MVEILSWGPRAEKNKYPNILEIFRCLKLIFRYRYQLIFIFSTFELYFRGYNYWIKSLWLPIWGSETISQRAYTLLLFRIFTFTSKKSNEIFLKILFVPTEIFSCLRFCHFPMRKKWSFPLRFSSVNVTKSEILNGKLHFSRSVNVN